MLHQAAKPSEVVGQKIAGESSGLSAATWVANVKIMKMAEKSQCYYKLADYVNANRISWPDCDIETKASLTEELEYVKEKDVDSDGKRYVMSKKQVKELINRSPDISDAVMLRMWFELLSFGGIKAKAL